MRITTIRLPGAAVLALVALSVAGCSGGHDDLTQWVAQQKARKGAPLPPLPVVKTFETFIYQDQDMRDPFAPPHREAETSGVAQGPRPDPDRVKEPLEQYALDSLKMVGTIGSGTNLVALIADPQGAIHRVRDGNYAGKNYGHIVGISENGVNLVELVPNGSGGWMERDARLELGGDNP